MFKLLVRMRKLNSDVKNVIRIYNSGTLIPSDFEVCLLLNNFISNVSVFTFYKPSF